MARIRIYTAEEWQAALPHFPAATAFDTAWWHTAHASAFGLGEPTFLCGTEKLKPIVGLAFATAKGKLRDKLAAPRGPFTPYRNILVANDALKPSGDLSQAGALALDHLWAAATQGRPRMDATLPAALPDWRPITQGLQPHELRLRTTHIRSLRGPLEYGKDTAKEVRQALERGFTLRPLASPDAFGGIYQSTAQRKGFYVDAHHAPTMALIGQLWAQTHCELWGVYDADSQLSAAQALLIGPHQTAYAWLLGSNAEAEKQGATVALMHLLLEHCKGRGLEAFDFCGANLPSVSRFKAQFGGTLQRYALVEWDGKLCQSRNLAMWHLRQAVRAFRGK